MSVRHTCEEGPMNELSDLELESVSGGAEKVALLGPLLISAFPILFPPKKVAEARAVLAQRQAK